MPSTTTRFAIPKPDAGDPFADGDDVMRAMADRIDYCLGENGDNTITPSAANTKTTKTIAFARTYKTAPRVLVCEGQDGAVMSHAPGAVSIWVEDVTTTDFTVGIQRTNTNATPFTYMVRPKNTDVTP